MDALDRRTPLTFLNNNLKKSTIQIQNDVTMKQEKKVVRKWQIQISAIVRVDRIALLSGGWIDLLVCREPGIFISNRLHRSQM